jgi:hypothetical protein
MGSKHPTEKLLNIETKPGFQRAFPEQTIDGLSVDNIDKNGSLSQKVFRHHARLHLPSLRSLMQERLKEGLKTEIDNQKQEKGL